MTTTKFTESAKLVKSGSKFRVRIISEGVGSSGTYPADVLQRDGASAWPAGTQIFFDHLTESDEWERAGNHSIKDLVGVTLSDPQWVEEEKALYTEAKFFESAVPFINDAKDYIGLSVEASGVIENGIVESIVYSPLNAIAVVPRAGRDGKITELIESYRESNNSGIMETTTAPQSADTKDRKETGMDPKDIEAIAEAVGGKITAALNDLKESLKPATPAENEETEAPKVSEVAEAMATSGLTESSRKRVYAAIEAEVTAGKKPDVNALIEAEKAHVAEVLKEHTKADEETNPGRIRESATKTGAGDDFSVKGW